MVQPAQSIEVCSPRCKECSAVATMVELIDIISKASATMVNTSTRRTGGLSPRALKTPSAARASSRILMGVT